MNEGSAFCLSLRLSYLSSEVAANPGGGMAAKFRKFPFQFISLLSLQ